MEFVLTNTTCSEACWHAREEVCRCSCGGRNHGCLKVEGGVRPARTRLEKGVRYELKAIGGDVEKQARELNKAAGIQYLFAHTSREWFGFTPAAIVRSPTADQLAKWPELAGEKERTASLPRWKGTPQSNVHMLWVRL